MRLPSMERRGSLALATRASRGSLNVVAAERAADEAQNASNRRNRDTTGCEVMEEKKDGGGARARNFSAVRTVRRGGRGGQRVAWGVTGGLWVERKGRLRSVAACKRRS